MFDGNKLGVIVSVFTEVETENKFPVKASVLMRLLLDRDERIENSV